VIEFIDFADCAEPLTVDKYLSDCLVAGKSFRHWQEEVLSSLDLERVLYVRSNAWISKVDLPGLSTQGKILGADVVLASFEKKDLDEVVSGGTELSSFEVKYAWDLLKVNESLVQALEASEISGDVSERAELNGHVIIGRGTKILPGVYIEGNVIIGEGCKIGPNCYIRGNTFIGDNCHIGQSVEIKNCLIMNKTNVGHLSYVGDSVLGAHVNFGAGTMTSNLRHDNANHKSIVGDQLVDTKRRKFGVVIGDGVHTGINTSFYPGRKMWPQSSTLPAAVVSRDVKP
jgi:UDP-N-acetylglucosamine diphosphorylase / glucose-1-phosphate thymidylyltransferase / UDP-N-acetylgalactosamine diphosphorylase / glucosamine-1-phosphate N-acetyltransferase / galactosamine-1-phosphate N-acetyltransferase